jgi:hypothetical protein
LIKAAEAVDKDGSVSSKYAQVTVVDGDDARIRSATACMGKCHNASREPWPNKMMACLLEF